MEVYGARLGLFMFGTTVIVLGLLLAVLVIKKPARGHWRTSASLSASIQGIKPAPAPSLGQAFWYASWQNRNLLALNQAGLVEKFTDALVWIIPAVWFVSPQHLTLVQASSIIGVYALVWGAKPAYHGFGI